MGRRYVLTGENLTLGTGSVLAAMQSAAAGSAASLLGIERVEVSQSHNTSTAQLRLALATRNTAGTLTMTSQAPVPLYNGGPASGLSGSTAPAGGAGRSGINSSADSGGAYTTIIPCAFNNQNGFLWQPIPEHKLIIPASTLFVVYFLTAPGDTAGWTVSVYIDEIQ